MTATSVSIGVAWGIVGGRRILERLLRQGLICAHTKPDSRGRLRQRIWLSDLAPFGQVAPEAVARAERAYAEECAKIAEYARKRAARRTTTTVHTDALPNGSDNGVSTFNHSAAGHDNAIGSTSDDGADRCLAQSVNE